MSKCQISSIFGLCKSESDARKIVMGAKVIADDTHISFTEKGACIRISICIVGGFRNLLILNTVENNLSIAEPLRFFVFTD